MSKALAQQGANIDFVVPYKAEHPSIDFMKVHSATDLSPLDRYGMGAYDNYAGSGQKVPDVDSKDLNDVRDVQRHYVEYVENLVSVLSPDVIHVHDWLTMEAGIRAKEITNAPLIVHVHATEFDRCANGNGGNPMVHEIEYQGLMMADRIIAVSNITKDIIVEKYGIPADKIEVVYNALDLASLNNGYEYDARTYKYLEELRREGYSIISTVTRFTVQKGLVNFIRAAAKAIEKYDKLAFLLAGDGEQRDELIKLTADLGIADKVFFTGFVRGRQWRDTYGIGDIFVMSSVSEPFGLTALEAAHYGNAIILTKQSGVGEVLRSVLKYDFWDEDDLADKIIGIATSNVLRDSLRQNVLREYSKISWHDVASSCLQIYKLIPQRMPV